MPEPTWEAPWDPRLRGGLRSFQSSWCLRRSLQRLSLRPYLQEQELNRFQISILKGDTHLPLSWEKETNNETTKMSMRQMLALKSTNSRARKQSLISACHATMSWDPYQLPLPHRPQRQTKTTTKTSGEEVTQKTGTTITPIYTRIGQMGEKKDFISKSSF